VIADLERKRELCFAIVPKLTGEQLNSIRVVVSAYTHPRLMNFDNRGQPFGVFEKAEAASNLLIRVCVISQQLWKKCRRLALRARKGGPAEGKEGS
jgi:hypothetical protein